MSLLWCRRHGSGISIGTCAVFLYTTLSSVPAIAQAEAAGRVGPGREQEAPNATASYDESSRDSLVKHVEGTAGASAPSAAASATPPPAPPIDAKRALAALPSGGGGVSPQAASLPSGPATQLGMGESFTMQLSTGTAGYTVPFALPAARGRAQPSLSLMYSSGAGSAAAGVGWSIGAPAIERQTDRGLPGYDDQASWQPDQDRFTFSGSELVPICTVSGTGCAGAQAGEVMPTWSNGWQYFRPRIEGTFARFFWSPDHQTWRVQSKDGVNMELGVPLDGTGYVGALERNPNATSQIFRWYLVRQYDAQTTGGANLPVNTVVYRYSSDGDVPYLTDIFDTSPASTPTTANLALYAHHTSIAYEARPDVGTSYRAGYAEVVARRASRIDVTSKSFGGGAAGPRELLRRYYLGYDTTAHRSLLTSVQMEGRCSGSVTEDGTQSLPASSCPRLPPLTFEYQHVAGAGGPLTDSQGRNFEAFDDALQSLAASPPISLDDADTGLLDVNGDGLPDLLSTRPGVYGGKDGLYINGSGGSGAVGFARLSTMSIDPTADVTDPGVLVLHDPTVSALDLDSDGLIDLVHMPQAKRYSVFSPAPDGAGGFKWAGRDISQASQQNVKINFAQDAPNVRVMDVNGDGLVDVVYSSATDVQTFFALGRFPGGDGQFGSAVWTSATTAQISNDPVAFCSPWSATPVSFSDADTVIADMNGDGLPDIVRVRDGDIRYWPGRGNGFWGTGDASGCASGSFAVNREIEMQTPPRFGSADPGSLLLNDVDGDGLADLVIVRSNAVEIYLNDNAVGWTAVHRIAQTPFRPAQRSFVRLTDINGSGTPDILWGAAYGYKYIDLTGGVIPDLLTKIHNGLGETLELDYDTSTHLMLAADAAKSPWTTFAPTPTQVLVASIERDNLQAVGAPGGAYTRTYSYRNPVYEGRQREFRGFSDTVVTTDGDGNSPTSHQHTIFQLGECSLQFAGTASDVCTPPARWQDNWREALKGLAVLNETYDDNGVYQGTEHTAYELRQLYQGLDGRRVLAPLPSQMDRFVYDVASFDHQSSSSSLDEIVVNIPGIAHTEARSVVLRAAAGTAHVVGRTVYDNFGNVTDAIGNGCVSGCPNGPDEVTTTHSDFQLPAGDSSGWLWRQVHSYTAGSVNTARRHENLTTFDAAGDLISASNVLSGTLALDRYHQVSGASIAPQPPGQSAGLTSPTQILIESPGYDLFGNSTSDRGPSGHCSSRTYDPDYQQFPTVVRTMGGSADPSTGCGQATFAQNLSYDRGLGQVVDNVDLRGQPSHFAYDGFGRLTSITNADPAQPGNLAAQPSLMVGYQLPLDPASTPYAIIDVHRADGADPDTASYAESQIVRDGLGRTLVTLQQADPTAGDGGNWVASGYNGYDAKGAVARTFESVFYTGTVSAALTGPPSGTPFRSQEHDAFGRPSLTYGFDGNISLLVVRHALSTDVYDAADIQPTAHQGTYTTQVADGYGRAVQQVNRIKVSGAIEARTLLFQYLPTNEVVVETQGRTGSADVVRWMQYDSLGRRVLNVEPNTSSSFNPSPSTPPGALKAWRYAYDDAGDMVGFSDARGCGANYFYDTAGRLVAEDRSPCLATQDPYTPPNLVTGDGTEVFYRYDTSDPDTSSVVDAGGTRLNVDASQLWGRVASVSSLGSKAVFQYDALGHGTGVGVRIASPGIASQALAARYAPSWYVKASGYDAAGRVTASSSGTSVATLLGPDGTSALRTSYTKRGEVRQYASSYGTLVASSVILADGRPQSFTLADAASTQQYVTYDANLRPAAVQTYRGTAPLWSAPPMGSTYQPPSPTDDPTRQMLLEDRSFSYDEVGNLIRDEDDRLPNDWPATAKPVTRTFDYDDLYRLTHVTYAYPGGTADSWKSPFAAEDQGAEGEQPDPHVSFATRPTDQKFQYDWLGNIIQSTDDQQAFWDRSSGARTVGTSNAGPAQLVSASNRALAPSSAAQGDLSAAYDAAGNLTDLIVRRDGPCLPSGSSCWQRFAYEWDAVGELTHARRWDLAGGATPPTERLAYGDLSQPTPTRAPDAELRFAYDGSGARVLKTTFDAFGSQSQTLYVFRTLEVRDTSFDASAGDYVVDANTASVQLFAGPAIARILSSSLNLPTVTAGSQHVFLEFGDRVGSTDLVIDYATGELAEATTYQSYGALESDYRPSRWGNEREPYKFGGKEEDIQLGLAYFGARYYSPYLATWISPDPVTIHDLGSDTNPYAYVHGTPLMGVDPDGRVFGLDDLIVVAIIVGVVALASAASNAAQQTSSEGWGNVNWGGVALAGAISAVSTTVGIATSVVLGPGGAGMGAGVASALGSAVGSTTGYAMGQAAGHQAVTLSGLAISAGTGMMTAGAGTTLAGAVGAAGGSAAMRAVAAGVGSSLMGAGLAGAQAAANGRQASSWSAMILGIGTGIATSVGGQLVASSLSVGGRAPTQSQGQSEAEPPPTNNDSVSIASGKGSATATPVTWGAGPEAATKTPDTYGPFTHQLNKGGLEDIQTNNELMSTLGRYGDEAVRATSGALPQTPSASGKTIIEFHTTVPPSYIHPTNGETFWYMPEGTRLPIFLTGVSGPKP